MAGASPIRCVGERITATGVPEFREVAWRAYMFYEGASDVALWAHLGGFIAGFLLFQYFLRKDYPA
ncbi:rhomboid family intramembrane serine protease [Bathymodiolus platifrons methanotrophic gill symbiont]|uniref:rhomboid family intramembrane serine protease n=1 Tax=Bathymodiolus platifrons methanotrophic gill symbiont TaxID=113268 RepID=UPI001E437D5E|nr:rhomboid family intramembrane serine protease [Bathymodiolus platifrons methanotrophic gill symbiont]